MRSLEELPPLESGTANLPAEFELQFAQATDSAASGQPAADSLQAAVPVAVADAVAEVRAETAEANAADSADIASSDTSSEPAPQPSH